MSKQCKCPSGGDIESSTGTLRLILVYHVVFQGDGPRSPFYHSVKIVSQFFCRCIQSFGRDGRLAAVAYVCALKLETETRLRPAVGYLCVRAAKNIRREQGSHQRSLKRTHQLAGKYICCLNILA